MRYRLLRLESSAIHHGNRQDAREGGESPPLPRNCERPCFRPRRIGLGRQDFSQGFSAVRKAPETTGNECLMARFWEGG
jgi:hypothetical protein